MTQRTRVAVILDAAGRITDICLDGEMRQLDIVIATRRRDGELTGRPITMLATRNEGLVARAFEKAEHPSQTEVTALSPEAENSKVP